MPEWEQLITAKVSSIEQHLDELKQSLHERLGFEDLLIATYAGYGDRERLLVRGRVLANAAQVVSMPTDTLWRNLLNTYKRLESDEVAGARLKILFQGSEKEVVTGNEGYFACWLPVRQPLPQNQLWHEAEVRLLDPLPEAGMIASTARAMVPSPQARFGIISDIDDTVVQTHATQLLRMARTVFLGNARTRLPFPGVAAFYRALQAGSPELPRNPLFYVSSSPWNLYDLLVEFFQLQGIPLAPLFLRDWGISSEELLPTRHSVYKLEVIDQILEFYEDMPFILIGDSGQEDPEIYYEVTQKHPDRIWAIYIRDVTPDVARRDAIAALQEQAEAANVPLLFSEDTLAMAEHAAARGWITKAHIDDVFTEKRADEAEPAVWEQLLADEAA